MFQELTQEESGINIGPREVGQDHLTATSWQERTKHVVRMRANENNRNGFPTLPQFSLQFAAGHAGHVDIGDKATCVADATGCQKCFRRRKRPDGKSELAQQFMQLLAH